ncbi:MAG TPA: hypothetical protein VHB50_23155, partial [Bryobacteraceae bacterium]|nr:hypothetical protein [Bryobacteraceae bacterium]
MITETAAPLIPAAMLARDIQIFEYSKAANPIASGATPRIPIKEFPADLYETGRTRIVPLDLSGDLRTPWLATGPGLLASFVRIRAGESIRTAPNAGSQFVFVIRGQGRSEIGEGSIVWKAGDFIVLPGIEAVHHADEETAFYTVDDSPLFAYLGARKAEPRFQPALYTRESVLAQLESAINDPDAAKRSRVSVLLANRNFEQTMTISHTLWTMFGIVSPGTRQLPHRHQSVALDYVVDAKPGVYTLVGPELN